MREAEIRDQITRIESAREEGLKEGMEKGMKELAVKLINRGIDIDVIV